MSKTHDLNLDRGAINLLMVMLQGHSWYDTPADAYRAGEVLELPEFDDPAKPAETATQAEKKEYLLRPVTITVGEKQRDTLKRCVDTHAKKGFFGPSKHANRLLRELGLAPTE